jgi:hypothetical protein
MTHDDKTALMPSPEPEASLTPAERMRRHRDRRRRRVRYLGLRVIDALVRRGFLRAATRNDRNAVTRALYAYFDHTLGAVR